MVNHRLLRKIPLQLFLDKQYSEEVLTSDPHNQLQALTEWFNLESNWVVSSLLGAGSSLECTSLISVFLQTAERCLQLNNFSSAMAIFSSLSMAPIQRLSSAWSQVPPKYSKLMAEFDRIFSFKMNYGTYRDMLRNAEGPRIPLFIVIFRDLTHFEEAHKDKYLGETVPAGGHKRVNFARLNSLAPHLLQIRNYQLEEYEFEEKPSFQLEARLHSLQPISTDKDELFRLADEREQRDTSEIANKRKKKRESLGSRLGASSDSGLVPLSSNSIHHPMSENLAKVVVNYQATRRRSSSIGHDRDDSSATATPESQPDQ
jgi:hypothetical protein